MRLAAAIGLDVAPIEPRHIRDRTFLLVQRYDRAMDDDGTARRIHQEDFCQALGVPPETKYASEGGPAFKDCFALLRRIAARPAFDVLKLPDAVIFNVIAGNADAHGKHRSARASSRKRPPSQQRFRDPGSTERPWSCLPRSSATAPIAALRPWLAPLGERVWPAPLIGVEGDFDDPSSTDTSRCVRCVLTTGCPDWPICGATRQQPCGNCKRSTSFRVPAATADALQPRMPTKFSCIAPIVGLGWSHA